MTGDECGNDKKGLRDMEDIKELEPDFTVRTVVINSTGMNL